MSQPAPAWFEQAIATPCESRFVEVQGAPIHYLAWGERGRPGLVFVHGGAAHAHWWSFIAPFFLPEYRCVAVDLSGHGDSGRRPEQYPRELWAEEVLAAAQDAGIDAPPILIGHSMGGFVCMAAAADHGEKLDGALIIESPVKRPDPESEEGAYGKAFRNPKVYPDEASALARYRLVPEQPCENRFVVDYIARHSVARVEGGFSWKFDPWVFRRISPRAGHELLPRVRCRIALMRGEFGMVTPDIGDYMYELLGREAPVIEIPQAHHHLMLDQPLAFVAALRTLLAEWRHSTPLRRTTAKG